jgi:hypothetical protein
MKGLRWRLGRRPSPALIVALVALVFATTPVADAATSAVKRALFASNAGGALAAGSHSIRIVGDETGNVGSLVFDETNLAAVLLGS